MNSGRKRKAVKYTESSSSGSEKEEDDNDDESSDGFCGGASSAGADKEEEDDDDMSFSGDKEDDNSNGGNASDDTEALMRSLKERFIVKKKTPTKKSSSITPKATSSAVSKTKPSNVAKKASAAKQLKKTTPTTALTTSASSGVINNKKARSSSPTTKTASAITTPTTTKSGSPAKKTKVSSSSSHTIRASATNVVDKSKYDSMDVLLPSQLMGLGGGGGDEDDNTAPPGSCSVLIQVPPENAKGLDFEGVSGAIGRLEVIEDSGCLVLDLKGCQYQASILPGPTAMVVGFVPTKVGVTASAGAVPQLRVEAITDEFATLVKTNDSMLQLDAKVQGDYNNDGTERFGVVEDDNVNKRRAPSTGADGSASSKRAKK